MAAIAMEIYLEIRRSFPASSAGMAGSLIYVLAVAIIGLANSQV